MNFRTLLINYLTPKFHLCKTLKFYFINTIYLFVVYPFIKLIGKIISFSTLLFSIIFINDLTASFAISSTGYLIVDIFMMSLTDDLLPSNPIT